MIEVKTTTTMMVIITMGLFVAMADDNKPYAYSECAFAKSITLFQVKDQPI